MSIIDKILMEATLPVESLFSGHNVNRYAFVWRDVTKYNTIEKKRDIVNKMEKLRLKSGKGLPEVELNPQLFIATQASIDSNNVKTVAHNMREIKELPMVVKLNGVYYLLDGHHRVSVALIAREKYVKVKFMDLDEGSYL